LALKINSNADLLNFGVETGRAPSLQFVTSLSIYYKSRVIFLKKKLNFICKICEEIVILQDFLIDVLHSLLGFLLYLYKFVIY